jgi:hypothetical protein
MEAWTAEISSDLYSETFDLSFGEERGARATPVWDEIAQIHRSGAKTPLLVVLFVRRQNIIRLIISRQGNNCDVPHCLGMEMCLYVYFHL